MRLGNLLVSLALVFLISATTTAQRSAWSGFKDLTLEIAAPKEKYVQLQSVPLVLTLSNKTDRILYGHPVLAFSAHYLRISVRREGEEWRDAQTTGLHALVYVNPRAMSPGDKFTKNEILGFRIEEIFPGPGRYELKARMGCSDGSQLIESPPIPIRITEPEGDDLEAYNFLRKHTQPEYFFSGYTLFRDKTAVQTLEDFVTRFEDTAYGADAMYLLGQFRFVKNDLLAARLQFEKLARRRDFIFADGVRDYLAKIDRKEALLDRP